MARSRDGVGTPVKGSDRREVESIWSDLQV